MDTSFFVVRMELTLIITQSNCVSKSYPHRPIVDLEEKVVKNRLILCRGQEAAPALKDSGA